MCPSKSHMTLGMDDIDSPRGGCTTHFASLVVEQLESLPIEWNDYPNLIRLNPNIPFRTRGNGAVALRFSVNSKEKEEIFHLLTEMTAGYIERDYPNTNPGIILIEGDIPERIKWFSKQATWRAVSLEVAKRIINKEGIEHYSIGNQRGLIGALSAAGNPLEGDYTYEYIAYRTADSCDAPRGVELASVKEMNRKYGNSTFSNLDHETGYMLIEPHGPDPVLYGIRGEKPEQVKDAAEIIKSEQKKNRWMIFRSNQGTGSHLTYGVRIGDLRPYMSACVSCRVSEKPHIIEGGHVIFRVRDHTGEIDCAAYEPTGSFREIVQQLIPGDEIILHSGVRPSSSTHGLTLNVEGLEIAELAEKLKHRNPLCPECGKRLKSAGRDKGFKCERCGFRSTDLSKKRIVIERELEPGLYLPPPRAQRHLTRPKSRISKSNAGKPVFMMTGWYSV